MHIAEWMMCTCYEGTWGSPEADHTSKQDFNWNFKERFIYCKQIMFEVKYSNKENLNSFITVVLLFQHKTNKHLIGWYCGEFNPWIVSKLWMNKRNIFLKATTTYSENSRNVAKCQEFTLSRNFFQSALKCRNF